MKKFSKEDGDRMKQLRQKAEEALRGHRVDLDGLPTEDIQYLLHELQVHQEELAIQNEELRQVQQDLEISRDLYSNLFDFAPVGYCTLSQKGRILNANETLEAMLGVDQDQLLHHSLSEFVDPDDQDEYYLHRQRAFKSQQRQESEIRLIKPTGEKIVVRFESKVAHEKDTQLMVILSDITEQRRIKEQQQAYAAQVDLQHRLIEQSESERMELARNLHDGPIQTVTGLSFSLKLIDDLLKERTVDLDGPIKQMGTEIKHLAAELRGICNNLRPPVLSKLGLRRALQENAAEFQSKYPQIRISLELAEDPTLLPERIALALYRIYQQALSNILEHANASEVWIRIKFDPQEIVFEIQDDGQGFSGRVDWVDYEHQGHLGLVGMNERAEAIGGKMELFSQTGEGTIVRVSVPRSRIIG